MHKRNARARNLKLSIPNRKEVKIMKKLVLLFVAVAFLGSFSLVGCGSKETPPPPAKEEAKPAPAPETPAPAAEPAKTEAPAPEKK
jgi:hypothetical protein